MLQQIQLQMLNLHIMVEKQTVNTAVKFNAQCKAI